MHCDRARLNIGMLLDGELPAGERETLGTHTAHCPECSRYREELMRMRGYLKDARERAPLALLDRVRASLEIEAAHSKDIAPAAPLTKHRSATDVAGRLRHGLQPYLRQAAVVLIACAISISGTWWWTGRTGIYDALAHDALAAHVRALLQDNAVQVASLDTHTVKPWFAGRLEYTPVVKDLSAQGFQLIGGRLDFIDGRRVATLVYRRRLHQISVFIWPSTSSDSIAPSQATINGYNLLSWSGSNMTFWAVSDLNVGELRELQALL